MLDRLAIILVGKQNAGKTTTLKHFCNTYDYKRIDTFKQGWRYGISPFSPKYGGVKINAYFLPGSPTEKKKPLKTSFSEIDRHPDFLFMAEQLHGAEYDNTIRFLRANNYLIKEFVMEEDGDSVWSFYEKKDGAVHLTHRTEAIAECVREFVRSRV